MLIPNQNQVTGTDGHVVVYDPNSTWRMWALHEIYLGREGQHKHVPKVQDLVVDMETGITYMVIGLDLSTLIPKLQVWQFIKSTDVVTEEDRLLGAGPYGHNNTIRLYVNKTVFPHTCTVDAFYTIGSVQARYARLFKGSVVDNNQEVISLCYDQSMTFLGNNIPLELVKLSNDQNIATKSVPPFHTHEDLRDHDLVTIIFYGDNGHVVSMNSLVVMESGFVRAGAADIKFITRISMETPYDSRTEPNTVVYPVNLPTTALNPLARVHYSDGTVKEMYIDGGRMDLMGVSNYIATIPGQSYEVTLRYALSEGEAAYGRVVGEDKYITETYTLRTGAVDNIWTVKLYCWPVWVDSITGYRLQWYLYNGERNQYWRVDHLIQYNDTNPMFDPIQYGVRQRISVKVNLSDISSIYRDYDHVQVFEIELIKQGGELPTLWRVKDYNADEFYGQNVAANFEFENQNLKRLDISCGIEDRAEWLRQIYRRTNPIFDPFSEIEAPDPTHIVLSSANSPGELEIKLDMWDQEIIYPFPLTPNDTMFLRFIRRMPGQVLQLSVAGMPAKQTN